MASENPKIDPKSGYCSETKSYHSLRPPVSLPSQPNLSFTSFAFSLLPSPLPTNPAIVDAFSGTTISYPSLIDRSKTLSSNLKTLLPNLFSPNQAKATTTTAFILSPASPNIPILYFSLLSLGIVVNPSNPLSTPSEISHQIRLSKPSLFFATSSSARSLPSPLPSPLFLLDSPQFLSLFTSPLQQPCALILPSDATARNLDYSSHNDATAANAEKTSPLSDHYDDDDDDDDGTHSLTKALIPPVATVKQSDTAAILYSSGTTGKVKGVAITHRNLIAVIAGFKERRVEREYGVGVILFTVPLFHVFGFVFVLGALAAGQTVVLMERFDFAGMLRAVERWRVNYMPVSPPLVVALAKSDEVTKYDLSSLAVVGCGGAPLGREVAERFAARFPNVEITQGYGLTESTGGASRTLGPDESKRFGSAGRLAENMEAKIVDPVTGESLPPGQKGELWLRGPSIMQGYIGDDEATASTLDPEGWLKTGDLCYFDYDGFLFIVDRLKELIKYKAYQVPPAELEHLLHSHPEIADAAVIPYPDEDAGQIPMAYVVRKPGSTLSEKQVMDFIAKQVAPYKKIRRVAFLESIPKSPAGKILRRELMNHALTSSASKL